MIPKRHWFQFSLKAMLVLMTLASLPLAWLAYERNEVCKRDAAIEEIEKLGGTVYFDEEMLFRPNWLRPLLGGQSDGEVDVVNFNGKPVSDLDLTHVAGLTKLKTLILRRSRVTNAGLAQLADLRELEYLNLDGTQVTDAGLLQLGALTKLESLSLAGDQVTIQGTSELRKALPNLVIHR